METEMTVGELLNSIWENEKEIEKLEKRRVNQAKAKTRRETTPRQIQAKNVKPFHHIIVENIDMETERSQGLVTGSRWTDFRAEGKKGKLEMGCISVASYSSETMAEGTYWVVDATDEDLNNYRADQGWDF